MDRGNRDNYEYQNMHKHPEKQGSCKDEKDQDQQSKCLPAELIKNGGFELSGITTPFRNWEYTNDQINLSREIPVYEGIRSASFNSRPTANAQDKSAKIFQNVTVNPGCFLSLSFADNFLVAGPELKDLKIRARVFYGNVSQTNLIDIEILYEPTNIFNGFNFHQKVTDQPVPSNVTSVTVEFEVQIYDKSSLQVFTRWFLDGVSLRAV